MTRRSEQDIVEYVDDLGLPRGVNYDEISKRIQAAQRDVEGDFGVGSWDEAAWDVIPHIAGEYPRAVELEILRRELGVTPEDLELR